VAIVANPKMEHTDLQGTEWDMAQQQADLSNLRESAVVFFRSYGLSFSDGLNALLKDATKPDSTDNTTGKTINTVARSHGLTNDDVFALEKALEDTRDKEQVEPLRI